MATASFSSASELTGPSVIDAHLMSVACEGVGVVLTDTHRRLSGRFDLADGFAEIAFIDQSPSAVGIGRSVDWSRRSTISTAGRSIGSRPHRGPHCFRPASAAASASDHALERRALPRVAGTCRALLLNFAARRHPRLSRWPIFGGGARLVVPREAGLERRGQTVDGWLRLPDDVAIPLSVEVRHVAEHDTARLVGGVRFERVRASDQTRDWRNNWSASQRGLAAEPTL